VFINPKIPTKIKRVKAILINITKILAVTTIDGIKDAIITIYRIGVTIKDASDTVEGLLKKFPILSPF